MHTLSVDIAPLRNESLPQKRSGMARVLRGCVCAIDIRRLLVY